jgi:hypothetical protein
MYRVNQRLKVRVVINVVAACKTTKWNTTYWHEYVRLTPEHFLQLCLFHGMANSQEEPPFCNNSWNDIRKYKQGQDYSKVQVDAVMEPFNNDKVQLEKLLGNSQHNDEENGCDLARVILG